MARVWSGKPAHLPLRISVVALVPGVGGASIRSAGTASEMCTRALNTESYKTNRVIDANVCS